MRMPLRRNRIGSQVAVPRSIPAPVDGWNTEDALAAMKPTYAVILDNWIPRAGKIEMRRGFIEQVTGTAAAVETLIVYSGGTGDTIFACAGTDFYDVTTAGALPSAEYVSAESARWNWINFANDAGRFALMCNGEQVPLKYDGSTFSTNAITGTSGAITLDDDDLKFVFAHKSRVHWLEKERLRVWVLATSAIAGASTLLDLGPVFSSGGNFVGGASWSRDNGIGGLDDFAVYVTSEGQVAVYQGSDPTDANNWALVGMYDIPKPVGDRPLIKDGGELCIVTEEGLLPLSIAVAAKRDQQRPLMLSRKVASAFADAARDYGSLNGWQATYYSGRGGLIIINVPTEEGVSAVQFVRASERGAWTRFTGIPAICWGTANGEVYFGGEEGVYRWDVGASDNSEPITIDVLPAFSDFGDRTRLKEFTMVRALLYAPSIVRPALDVVVEYDKATLPTAVATTVTPGDISDDDNLTIRDQWTGAAGVGYVASPRLRSMITGADDVDRVAVTADLTELLLVGPGGSDNILTRPNLPLDVSVELVGFDLMFKVGGQL
jgi:hypothetical protein